MFDLFRVGLAITIGVVLLCILSIGVIAFWPLLLILLFLF